MNYEYWVLNDKRRLLSSVEKAKRLISRNSEKRRFASFYFRDTTRNYKDVGDGKAGKTIVKVLNQIKLD
jgi:hypothetical protein